MDCVECCISRASSWIDVVLCMEDKCAHIALRERVREYVVVVFYRYASDIE